MSADSARHAARALATGRPTRVFSSAGVLQSFGCNTFRIADLRQHTSSKVVARFEATLASGEGLDKGLADEIARAVVAWATARGVSHYCHWFQPMTGATAEKHDAFLAFDGVHPIAKFTGAMLIQSEPDASSFPSGGMRSTFEARGYTAWDPTSPIFIMERTNGATLCIPSVFISYHGDALDKKAPLLRSMRAIQRTAVALAQRLGDSDVTAVTATAGPEQEYFLVDKAWIALRPDLAITGRSQLGAPAPKGQTLEDHYFGSIPSRVLAFMQEVEAELYKLGVAAKTRHNEVAPCQFELAVLYTEANVAADHNQLVMEILKRVANRHGFVCLLHEKPFAGVNGSGKHLNWSMQDNLGRNLLEPGDNPQKNLSFLAYLAATVLGVYRHAAVLRATIGSHGNDFRLGANEAPPAILSVFLGNQLSAIVEHITGGAALIEDPNAAVIELGVASLPRVSRDNTDRNRTSPFAFTGNKFEFRAVGSGMSISFPLAALNTAVADGMDELCRRIDAHGKGLPAVWAAVREALAISKPVIFEGNGYSAEWVVEAERRGLPHLRNTPEAVAALHTEAATALFTRHGVLTADELHSRYHIRVERYLTTVAIEATVIRELVDQFVLPDALSERTAVSESVAQARAAGVELDESDLAHLQGLQAAIVSLRKARAQVDAVESSLSALEGQDKANAAGSKLVPALANLRAAADAVEVLVADQRWSLPRYREMLFQNG